jgi:DNA adenine methylase
MASPQGNLFVEFLPENIFMRETVTVTSKTRRVKSPFRYPGGKYYGLKILKPYTTAVRHDEYREPFFGGGAVFFAKPKARYNWLNDVLEDLVTTLKVIADPKERKELISRLSGEVATKDRHERMKYYLPGTDVDTAYKYYYLNRTSYSGIMNKPAWGYEHGKSSPPHRWADMIEIAGEKLEDSKITCLDFEAVVDASPLGDSVFMFLDPPYYESDQKRAYEHHFIETDHRRLARLLKKTKFKFLLTYDNCKAVKELYSWAKTREASWQYNTANTDGTRSEGRELIITNYSL